MSFWIKTNRFVKRIFPNYIWDIPNNENKVFLTFDDGPTPEITEWTLEQLKKYDAKATFFCIGNNIEKHSEIFQKLIQDNHAIGNHTINHLKGWETSTDEYVKNTRKCSLIIEKQEARSKKQEKGKALFRPPYGKIKPSQSRVLRKLGYKIIMWDVLSYDFDQTITPEKCLENVLKNVESGSIIVFHDSLKAEQNLRYVLPKTLAFLKEKGFVCEKID
ncbi:polysaccharide deacetylase family protein [Flavobacterium sp.]|uniref:polysaccharide deacetylase family protein n=1 Tax=Flavobacterium sp. TaxID=239 RepID=UPI0025F05C2F|nr:polysaccharide deacetylase family protein [Flavobacterium sp.]